MSCLTSFCAARLRRPQGRTSLARLADARVPTEWSGFPPQSLGPTLSHVQWPSCAAAEINAGFRGPGDPATEHNATQSHACRYRCHEGASAPCASDWRGERRGALRRSCSSTPPSPGPCPAGRCTAGRGCEFLRQAARACIRTGRAWRAAVAGQDQCGRGQVGGASTHRSCPEPWSGR